MVVQTEEFKEADFKLDCSHRSKHTFFLNRLNYSQVVP